MSQNREPSSIKDCGAAVKEHDILRSCDNVYDDDVMAVNGCEAVKSGITNEEAIQFDVENDASGTTRLTKIKIVLPIIVLNVILPTVDIFTDLILVIKLMIGAYDCHYPRCYVNPQYCDDLQFYNQCMDDPDLFCSKENSSGNHDVCTPFETHPRFATALLVPFLLSYIFCFITWTKLEKEKQKTIMLPLVNLYPQTGKIFG